jgi:hypothetical protein
VSTDDVILSINKQYGFKPEVLKQLPDGTPLRLGWHLSNGTDMTVAVPYETENYMLDVWSEDLIDKDAAALRAKEAAKYPAPKL